MHKIFQKLSSIKLAIILFIIIAISSLIGTLIIQEQPQDILIQKYGDFLYNIFNFLGFFDLYHSWWFISMLVLFSLNIIVCSVNIFSPLYKQVFKPSVEVDDTYLGNLKNSTKIKLSASKDKFKSGLIKYLKKKGYKIKEREDTLLSYKGSWSRFSVLIVHISFLLILAGALIGAIWGYKGYIEIEEGSCVGFFYLRNSDKQVPLGFMVFLKKFTVEFYKNKNIPKSFISEVEIKESCSGESILTKKIEVNHPLSFRGIKLYQSSYGNNIKDINIQVIKNNIEIAKINTSLNKEEIIKNTNYKIKVLYFIPDFALDENMQIFSKSEEPNNPAIFVQLMGEKEKTKEFWIFLKFPDFHKLKESPFDFRFLDFKQNFYSGLQVVNDPGIPFVYSGCILILIGLFLSLCFYYRKIWFKFKDDVLIVAGISNKNSFSFSEEFQKIISEIKSFNL